MSYIPLIVGRLAAGMISAQCHTLEINTNNLGSAFCPKTCNLLKSADRHFRKKFYISHFVVVLQMVLGRTKACHAVSTHWTFLEMLRVC